MKIVLDTNTLINAESDEYNFSNRIIDAVLEGKIEAFANRQTLRENRLIVGQKIHDEEFRGKLEQFFDAVQDVEMERLNVVEDREDNKILASAVKAQANYLITSDWHLLKIGEYEGVKIVTPEGFWGDYESETGAGWSNWISSFLR